MGTSNPALIEAIPSRKAPPAAKRQHRSPELKVKIVQETLVPGASVACVARAHGVNANQVFAWRRQYRQGLLEAGHGVTAGLLAVRVADPEPVRSAQGKLRRKAVEAGARPKDTETRRAPSSMIQVELPKGRLRLTGSVDAEALRVVLEALLG
ncbi:MAG: IS66-like element accessory protein TnpA [Terriglobia bacterium]